MTQTGEGGSLSLHTAVSFVGVYSSLYVLRRGQRLTSIDISSAKDEAISAVRHKSSLNIEKLYFASFGTYFP